MHLLDIVLPVFLVIGAGYGLRRSRFLRAEETAALSRLVFYVAAPALLLRSVSRYSFDWSRSAPMLLVMGGVSVLLAAGVYLASRPLAPERRGVLAQGAQRSNTVFVGLPIVLAAFGDRALATASIVIAFMVIVENFVAVTVLTLPHRRRSARDPLLWGATALRILRNPLIIGCGGGLLLALVGLHLPASIDRTLDLIGRTAAPLGLLTVGAGLDFRKLRGAVSLTALAAVIKLALHPALVFVGLRALRLTDLALGVPVLIAACPTAVVSYIMAREMHGDRSLASAIVIGTTAASLLTLLGWLALLGCAD
ncbi:MAG: hypothetical protein GF330_05050 [Candidatus Eisenbacteria bacterium]|nr:hypothetical protein [Candidatus Eisenbacteria bacterium]